MVGLLVQAGTQVKVIGKGKEWMGDYTERRTTKRDIVFVAEDIVVDPIGRLGCTPGGKTIGSAWAAAGWYGFDLQRSACPNGNYATMLVPGDKVIAG